MSTSDRRRQLAESIRGTAEIFGLTPETVRRGVKSGTIPSVRIGETIRIPTWWIEEKIGVPEEPS